MFYVKICPVCQNGCVEFRKAINCGALVLICDECDLEWTDPKNILLENGVLYDSSAGYTTEPTLKEIQIRGWDKFISEGL